MNKKKTLMIILGGGGHTKQLLKLVKQLGKSFDYEYVLASDDSLSEKKIEIKGRVFRIYNPRNMEDRNLAKVILKFVPSAIQTLIMLFRSNAECIIAAGPAISLHTAWLGKFLFRKKVIFLESWSRVYIKSLAGRLTYSFADLFFVQWKNELKNYPKAVYAGRLG
ncbi:MAG: PssD/Cps14F family polysaccharide biosynthesis glycosyltransferase [archaeon]